MTIYKKLSKKHIKVVKISPFSLELSVVIGNTSQCILVSKNSVVGKIGQLKLLFGQICKICASAQNGLNDFAKSIGHQLKKLLLIIIYMNVRDYNCP